MLVSEMSTTVKPTHGMSSPDSLNKAQTKLANNLVELSQNC